MMRALFPAASVHLTPLDTPRSLAPERYLEEARACARDVAYSSLDEALAGARALAMEGDVILCTGSLFLVGASRGSPRARPWRNAAPPVNSSLMRLLDPSEELRPTGPREPTVDDVEFRALYKKTKYVVETADGWSLVITRYRPVQAALRAAAVRRAAAAGARLLAEPPRVDERASS